MRAARAPVWSSATAGALAGDLPSFAHCLSMFGRFGMFEFAHSAVRDVSSGLCLDDNARALIVAALALALDPDNADATAILRASLRFVETAQRPDGAFHNRMDQHGDFTDEIGSPDSIGRAAWACGITMRFCPRGVWREAARLVLGRVLPHLCDLDGLRPRAYSLLGLCHASRAGFAAQNELSRLADGLARSFESYATDDWAWWEPELIWGNARIPEAMLCASAVTGEPRLRDIGLRSMDFLASVTQPETMFVPIGNEGWYVRGQRRAIYDQQPIEACGMVDLWLAAEQVAGGGAYGERALRAFEWFFGNNSEGLMLANPPTGGCCDGLGRGCVNQNMGAESTLSYLQAHLAIAHTFHKVT